MHILCSHPELRKEVQRHKTSDYPDQNEPKANPGRFNVAVAEETEKRVSDKNEPSDRGEQNQCEKMVRVAVGYEGYVTQRGGNQGAAN